MELRTKFLNRIILDNGYKSYLEIGIDNCENYNGYEKITQNFTRRKFSILRYNPLINRLNFYTKKHFVSQNNPYNNTIKNHVSFKKYNPNVKLNTHKFRYGRKIR